MRKTICMLSVAAATALAIPTMAEARNSNTAAALGTGAVVGTVVGVGTYNGWWGGTVFGSALPTTLAGSAAVGGVVGVGTVALIDSVVQPCRGFQAVFGMNRAECVNGEYVGYAPRRIVR